jgi:tubulin---tyrosine ligase
MASTAIAKRQVLIHMDDPYVSQLLVAAFEARSQQWTVLSIQHDDDNKDTENSSSTRCIAKSDLQWDEYERIDWDRVDARKAVANWYTERKGLIRKAHLTYNIQRYTSKRSSALLAKHYPQTFFFELYHPDEIDELLICEVPEIAALDCQRTDAHAKQREVWILKPSITNQAADVHVFDSTATFRRYSIHRSPTAQRVVAVQVLP